jgi:hypothetical protein
VEIAHLPLVEGDYTIALALRADIAWEDYPELADLTVIAATAGPTSLIPRQARGRVTLDAASYVRAQPCNS